MDYCPFAVSSTVSRKSGYLPPQNRRSMILKIGLKDRLVVLGDLC
jgi:hypothetical protein